MANDEQLQKFWLAARLWPDGPLQPLRSVLVICGSPRSGTTWLHNALIRAKHFKGLLADDAADVGPDPFLTDENRYIHLGLFQARLTEGQSNSGELIFKAVCHLLYLRFGVATALMIKSPYYCFFADLMWASGLCKRFIFMRRTLDSISLSMMSHPHVGRQLRGPFQYFFDVAIANRNIEVENVNRDLFRYFVGNYDRLSLFDRGLFKGLCFSTAFSASRKKMSRDSAFIFEYDAYREDKKLQQRLQEFIGLNEEQNAEIVGLFNAPARVSSLPPHDLGFRNAILVAEKQLWASENVATSPA